MAQGQWMAGTKIAVGKLLVIGDVGAANTRCFNSNLELAYCWSFNDSSLLRRITGQACSWVGLDL